MSGAALLSDPILDAAFAASFDAGDTAASDYYGAEIRARLVSVWSFVAGVFGSERFPLFSARVNFSQSEAAQSSVADSASNTATSIAEGFKIGLGGVALFALVAVGIYAFIGRK